MFKLFWIIVILLATSEFGYCNNITHQTDCNFDEACVECHSSSNKYDNGFNESGNPYQALVVKKFNTYRNNFAFYNNISNMKYSIWMEDYRNLMKNMTLDIGEQNITCFDRLTGEGTHFTVVSYISPNENINELIIALINSNPKIFDRFDASRFGCFAGVKTSSDNKRNYLLRCLFFIDNFIETRQITGLPCKNCAKDVQCSEQYKGLCGKGYSEFSRGSALNMKRAELYIINAILLLLLSLHLDF